MTTIACDFGGTRIKVGLVRCGQVLRRTAIDAKSYLPLAERLPEVALAVARLCETEGIAPQSCHGIGIAFPGIVHPDGRVLGEFGKFGPVSSEVFLAWSRSNWGLHLRVENDARLALAGECACGAARGSDNAAMITLGTGIGTAAVVGGRLLVGAHGQAAILGGHQTVVVGGQDCVCGNVGCAEAEASTSVLSAMVAREAASINCQGRVPSLPTYMDVFRASQQGDAVAAAVAAKSLRVWGAVAVNLIHAYAPEVVILGGGVMGSRDIILPAIERYLRERAQTPWGQVALAASQLGDDAALVGAEWLINREQPCEAVS